MNTSSTVVSRAARIAAGLSLLLAVGCAGSRRAPPEEPPPPATPPASTPVVELPAARVPQPEPATPAAPEPRAAPLSPTQVEPVHSPVPATPTKPAASKVTGSTAASPQAASAKPQASAAAQPAPAPTTVPKAAPAPVAAAPAAPPLDLKSLETRLRETKAVGVFTKISLKNQVDDLLDRFRAYHRRETTTTLAALRQSYNLLLLKVLALLQDSDPPLARDIVASREAIWAILADPKRFTESNLMAGEMP